MVQRMAPQTMASSSRSSKALGLPHRHVHSRASDPAANQDPELRDVVTVIQQEIAGLPRVQDLSGSPAKLGAAIT